MAILWVSSLGGTQPGSSLGSLTDTPISAVMGRLAWGWVISNSLAPVWQLVMTVYWF